MQSTTGKRTLGLLATALLAGTLGLAMACSEDDDGDILSSPTPGSAATAISGDGGERSEFIRDIESRLSQLRSEFGRIETEIASRTGDQRQEAEARLDDLREQADSLEVTLARLLTSSEDDFDSLRGEIEEDLDSALTEAEELAEDLGI